MYRINSVKSLYFFVYSKTLRRWGIMIFVDGKDISNFISMEEIIYLLEEYMKEMIKNPVRIDVGLTNRKIVFTCGQSNEKNISGFRAYWRSNNPEFLDDITIVVDNNNNKIKGIVIGKELGILRTGGIGGIAIKYFSNPDAEILGIIGTGRQALAQCFAALLVRRFKKVIVFSRNQSNIDQFCNIVSSKKLNVEIIKGKSIKHVVTNSDVLICATNSTIPLFPPNWVNKGTHINTIGPKEYGKSEMCSEIADYCNYVMTDSLEQVINYPNSFFLSKHAKFNSIIDIRDFITNSSYVRKSSDITMFCSVGLSGTEVILANEIINRYTKSGSYNE